MRRDHAVAEGLDYVALWNSTQLASDDFAEGFAAKQQRRAPAFAKL